MLPEVLLEFECWSLIFITRVGSPSGELQNIKRTKRPMNNHCSSFRGEGNLYIHALPYRLQAWYIREHTYQVMSQKYDGMSGKYQSKAHWPQVLPPCARRAGSAKVSCVSCGIHGTMWLTRVLVWPRLVYCTTNCTTTHISSG